MLYNTGESELVSKSSHNAYACNILDVVLLPPR